MFGLPVCQAKILYIFNILDVYISTKYLGLMISSMYIESEV